MIRRIALVLLLCVGGMPAQQPLDEKSAQSAIEAYRRMWQAMTPEQRKTMVDAGGATPERYEQTLRLQLKGGAARPAVIVPEGAGQGAVKTDLGDTLRTSAEDRNAMRDANLARLREETCPPETALELAALRSRLSPAAMPSRTALLAVAENWSKRAPEAASREQASLRQADALAGVAAPAKTMDPAQLNAEIERLFGTCKR